MRELSWWWALAGLAVFALVWFAYLMGKVVGSDHPYQEGFLDGLDEGFERGYSHCIRDVVNAPSTLSEQDWP